ncbi:MAG TPA: hypothetical protein VGV89_09520 [Thermoplasmata archaeon]|nr:hypothetical protein [Thermoplasmata archaeon]
MVRKEKDWKAGELPEDLDEFADWLDWEIHDEERIRDEMSAVADAIKDPGMRRLQNSYVFSQNCLIQTLTALALAVIYAREEIERGGEEAETRMKKLAGEYAKSLIAFRSRDRPTSAKRPKDWDPGLA